MIEFRKGSASSNIDKLVNQGHEEYERSNGISDKYFEFYITASSNNRIVGVLSGYTVFAEIYIDDLWVDQNHRGQGHGRNLIKFLENKFEGEGYNNINLCTSVFQAPEFYKKCGYELEFIRKNKINPKLDKYFFVKFFSDKNQTMGSLN
jgi:ribosomal protein S18 acetylase RimI-like enzyme